ncbi:MAG: peptide-methionine (S)-S-oxide reductase MsrA [Longimicrobiales bacterium]
MFSSRSQLRVPSTEEALPGRAEALEVPELHHVSGTRIQPPFPDGFQTGYFGMGCFWGAERKFWELHGVYSTAAGYQGGSTPNPTYDEVCSGATGHSEVVLVVYDPDLVDYEVLLKLFWEGHDPTQGMRQGADIGTQYRSAIFVVGDRQRRLAEMSKDAFQAELTGAGLGTITTEIIDASEAGAFYYAEDYHQQYLAKNPGGYCGLGGTGVSCPVGVLERAE